MGRLRCAVPRGVKNIVPLDEATVDPVLGEADKFASDVIAPLNSVGDKYGTPFEDGKVTTPPRLEGGSASMAWHRAGAGHGGDRRACRLRRRRSSMRATRWNVCRRKRSSGDLS
jgi:hypothetical protein